MSSYAPPNYVRTSLRSPAQTGASPPPTHPDVRAIAFYLPQYHPIPENDEWWGVGFTEWRNVTRARPRFPGHYQPHLPADLGFYDLRLPEVRSAQADLARRYGIHGFCYYHYWFGGRRLLERPFNEVLESGEPDFPFCLCWANENWTRVWDGGESQVLMQQHYSPDDDLHHIRWLARAFTDSRYIRIDGKPLFILYRAESLPDPRRTTDLWRAEARRLGVGELFLCRIESAFYDQSDSESLGFDAAIEFVPDWSIFIPDPPSAFRRILQKLQWRIPALRRIGAGSPDRPMEYREVMRRMLNKPQPGYRRFRTVAPMWDNSARRRHSPFIVTGSTPELYRNWLRNVVTEACNQDSDRVVFLNAWNEWAEGCHLEPDLRWGHAYLEATRAALLGRIADQVRA
jgi:lipopolysaccharide biosynthesis protein